MEARKLHGACPRLLRQEAGGKDQVMSDEIRSLEQNAKFHAMLTDIADQLEWAGDRMDLEDWKRLVLGAAYGQHPVPNPFDAQAPFVIVNKRRSRGLVKPEMADLITQLQIFGDERGVKWRDEQEAA
jgi:hypothetical protein